MISIASDHGGYCLKEHIKAYLTAKGINVLDCGCDSQESCDYPIFAKAAAEAVADGRCEKGIVICTTGIRRLHHRQQGEWDPLCPVQRPLLCRDDPPPQ